VTRFLTQLTPEDFRTMRYGTPLFFIQVTITPEDAPPNPESLPVAPELGGVARPDEVSPARKAERDEGKKVHEMTELLKQYPLDALLVQAKDAEGNSFSPVFELTRERYLSRNAW
jgi:hypothetical protein